MFRSDLWISAMAGLMLASGVSAAPGFAATSTLRGGPVNGIVVVRGTDQREITSSTFADLPGAVTTVTVPAGQNWLTVGRFTGQTECFSYTFSSTREPCLARIVAAKGSTVTEFKPGGGLQSVISGVVGSAVGNVASLSLAGSLVLSGPATYQVKVQTAVTAGYNIHLLISYWQLEVTTAPQK